MGHGNVLKRIFGSGKKGQINIRGQQTRQFRHLLHEPLSLLMVLRKGLKCNRKKKGWGIPSKEATVPIENVSTDRRKALRMNAIFFGESAIRASLPHLQGSGSKQEQKNHRQNTAEPKTKPPEIHRRGQGIPQTGLIPCHVENLKIVRFFRGQGDLLVPLLQDKDGLAFSSKPREDVHRRVGLARRSP